MKRITKNRHSILTELRSRIAKTPTCPGVYRWLDAKGEVLYVGKAINLRNRLRSYVKEEPDKSIGPWKLALIGKIADVHWTMTETEIEALMLETNLIKELRPKYNVMMKDDKNYVYIRITVEDPYPAVFVVRRMEEDKAKYFGPYLSAGNVHKMLEMLDGIYRFRACRRSIDTYNAQHRNRSVGSSTCAKVKQCLEYQIGKCNGLCTGAVGHDDYRHRMDAVIHFLKGDRHDVLRKLETMMQDAALNKKFEQAASLRDTLQYIKSLEERQIVSGTSGDDTDAIGIALLANKAQVTVLRERGGKMLSDRSFLLQGEAEDVPSVLEQFIPQYYQSTDDIPDTILCEDTPESIATLQQWLTSKRIPSKRVTIHVPERGKKNHLLQMAQKNADEQVRAELASWEAATKKVDEALADLQKFIDLSAKPKRIECYDISHFDGSETVGSMVVAINGKLNNKEYRSFTIRTMKKGDIDDYKALKEVLGRRLRHLADDPREENRQWKREGITFGNAKKNEEANIREFLEQDPEEFSLEDFSIKDFLVARMEKNIIACGRLLSHAKNEVEIKNLWIHPAHRSHDLGRTMLRRLLERARKAKQKQVYIRIFSHMEEYYTQRGFRHLQALPPVLGEKVEKILKDDPDVQGMTLAYFFADNKTDGSLSTTPDLLVLDGGKGQLSAGLEVLKAMKLTIPIVGLAKREEEVFAPNHSQPLPFPKDAEGRFLLMRLRDEAHRFANRHREKRVKNALLG